MTAYEHVAMMKKRLRDIGVSYPGCGWGTNTWNTAETSPSSVPVFVSSGASNDETQSAITADVLAAHVMLVNHDEIQFDERGSRVEEVNGFGAIDRSNAVEDEFVKTLELGEKV